MRADFVLASEKEDDLRNAVLLLPQFQPHHQNRAKPRHAVCYRAGIHNAVDAHGQGQYDNQGQQEDDLPGEGEEDASPGFPDGSEEVGTDGLQEV